MQNGKRISLVTADSGSLSGFTLVEVLIATALLAIVIGAVYTTFFSVNQALKRFDQVSARYHDSRMTLDTMRREIEGALLKNSGSKNPTIPMPRFIIKDRDIFGKNTSALYLTAFSFRGSKLKTVSYYVSREDNILTLYKEEAPALAESTGIKVDMVTDIESFKIETLFNNKWVGTWDSDETGRLPEVVRLRIQFNDNGREVTMTEYAKPRVGSTL